MEHDEVRRHSSVVPVHVQRANDNYRSSDVGEQEKGSGDYMKERV
jgi:hypothetical protein